MEGDNSQESLERQPRGEIPPSGEGMSRPQPGPAGTPGMPPYMAYPPYTGYPPPGVPTRRQGVPWYVWLIGGCLALVVVVGILCAIVGGLFASFASRVANDIAHETPVASTATSTYTITGAPNIVVHNVTGNVSLVPGNDGVVQVTVTRHARDTSSTAAENDLAHITVDIVQRGNTITVDVQSPDQFTLTRQVSVDLAITVPVSKPEMANLDLTLVTGSVSVHGIKGTVRVVATTGDVDLSSVALSGSSRLDVTTGRVQVDGSLAGGASLDVRVTTGGATLTLPAATSAHVDAMATLGNITFSGWSIPVTTSGLGAKASGDLSPNPSGKLTINVTTGNIALSASS